MDVVTNQRHYTFLKTASNTTTNFYMASYATILSEPEKNNF
jgi:hypothetical protein